jgi:predicted helicase
MSFTKILEKYCKNSFSQKDKGNHFECLMQDYLLTYSIYKNKFNKVLLWNEYFKNNYRRTLIITYGTGKTFSKQTTSTIYD